MKAIIFAASLWPMNAGEMAKLPSMELSGVPSFYISGPTCLTIQPGISLCSDGKVTVPKGMKMDAAAKVFVDELKKYWPQTCGLKK